MRRRDLRTLLHPQKALDRILAAAVRSTRADSGSFILVNPNSGLLDIEASHGLSERAKKVKLRPGEGITGWVASTGKPLRTGDVRKEKRYVAISARIRSEMAVPVEMRGQVVGLLNVDSTAIDAFNETDEARLVDMASEAAQWLALAWEIDQLRLKSRQLTSLVDTAQTIISESNLDEILEQITLQTYRLMKARLCSVFLLNEDSSELVLRACHGGTLLYRDKPNLSTEDSLLGSVLKHRKPVTVVDVVREKGYIQTDIARKERLVSMLAVPLIFAEKAIGVLAVYTQQRHRFSNDEIKLLTTLGDLSAVAIEKGRLLARVVDMEENLRASERLSALGLLAAEIAHEIRNPLTVMQMLFHALMETLELDSTSQRDAELISEKMRQMNRILDQVLSFARSSEPIKEAVHAQQLIDDVFLLTRHKLLQQGIDIRSSVADDLPPFRADRAQVEQVLLNLILNATDAMPKGGTLRLSAALEDLDGEPHLALSVRDNGQGMSPDQIANLFAPFLTYKESGTGIGLAIVKKIMENHQSKVQVESKVGQGTKFKLLFPIVDPHRLRGESNSYAASACDSVSGSAGISRGTYFSTRPWSVPPGATSMLAARRCGEESVPPSKHRDLFRKKRLGQFDVALNGDFVATDRIELSADARFDFQVRLGNFELSDKSGTIAQDDLRGGEHARNLDFTADQQPRALERLDLGLGPPLDPHHQRVQLSGNLRARSRDDLLCRAQLAENFSAHLHAAPGRLHALEGAALGEEHVVVGVQLSRLHAAHDLVAQLEIMEAADALGREGGAGDEIGRAALDAKDFAVRLRRASGALFTRAGQLEIASAGAAIRRDHAFRLALRRLAVGTGHFLERRLFHGLFAAQRHFLQLLESRGPLAARGIPDVIEHLRLGLRTDLDLGHDQVARFQDQRARLDRSRHHAAGGDGQAAERLQVALEFSGQDDVLGHAQLSLEDDAGMNLEGGRVQVGHGGYSIIIAALFAGTSMSRKSPFNLWKEISRIKLKSSLKTCLTPQSPRSPRHIPRCGRG